MFGSLKTAIAWAGAATFLLLGLQLTSAFLGRITLDTRGSQAKMQLVFGFLKRFGRSCRDGPYGRAARQPCHALRSACGGRAAY
jgi:hypothetical protein